VFPSLGFSDHRERVSRHWHPECFNYQRKGEAMLLLLLLVILIFAAAPAWPYSRGWGYYPSGGLGTILLIVLVLMLLGMVHF
jgi:hypothetical protein